MWLAVLLVAVLFPGWVINFARGSMPGWVFLAIPSTAATVIFARQLISERSARTRLLRVVMAGPTCDPWHVALAWPGKTRASLARGARRRITT
jgi:hypothetical protein